MPYSDRAIEKLVLGELSAAEAAAMRQDPDVREREAALLASNAEILRAYPAERLAKQIERRRQRPRARVWAGVLVAACAAGFFLLPSGETDRAKGGASLAVWRKTAAAPELLGNGARVHAGDVVQIAYAPRGARFGAIVSYDGAGVVTTHLAMQALASEPTTLATAYELDAAPGFEHFVLFTSSVPFAVPGPSGPLPSGVAEVSVHLVKE